MAEQLLTGEQIRTYGYNPDTKSSIGGKFYLSQFTGGGSQPSSSTPAPSSSPTQTPTQSSNPERLYTGEEIRAMGYNGDTVSSIGGKYKLSQFTNTGDVTSHLNDFQANLYNQASSPEVKVPTMAEIQAAVTPAGGAPALINRNAELAKMRTEYGVADQEQQLTDLKASEREIQGMLDKQRFTEKGKPVAMGVISGRIGQEEQTAMTRLDQLTRQKATVIDNLNTSYSVINSYINNMGLDYADASAKYNTDLNNNMKMYDIILGQQSEARTAASEARKIASANLTTMMNAVTSGNLNYSSLSNDDKLMINKLEVQSGMPVGLMSSLKISPKDQIVFQSTDNGITQIGIRNQDGTISVQKYGTSTGGSGGGTAAEKLNTAKSDMYSRMKNYINSYGHVDPNTYNQNKQLWLSAGLDPLAFDSQFGSLMDPNRTDNAYNVTAK